jgi:hypothetical protein
MWGSVDVDNEQPIELTRAEYIQCKKLVARKRGLLKEQENEPQTIASPANAPTD